MSSSQISPRRIISQVGRNHEFSSTARQRAGALQEKKKLQVCSKMCSQDCSRERGRAALEKEETERGVPAEEKVSVAKFYRKLRSRRSGQPGASASCLSRD